ncbi:unnamed protein product [Clonostachys chloroleuca]|uniref:Major facilitator superfamily (MFS) profile domain-containing protein n=1 Tax=Clonostachys chloroleuca TaxID=1926264 RepID=A0AA35PUS1_9HYPO|nr:unnamed protein product [Clonostachys chloroleuca]
MANPHEPTLMESIKFFCVAGVGYFADGYMVTVIGVVVTMLGYVYFKDNGGVVPTLQGSAIKGCMNAGLILGQISFGILGDALGRKKVYGKELMFTIFGTLMCILLPWKGFSQGGVIAWMSVWRLVTGFGVGGDYPMSSVLAAERSVFGSRAKVVTMMRVFQMFGITAAYVVFVILLAGYRQQIEQNIDAVEWVWRLLMGIGIIPCILTIYSRMAMNETEAYKRYIIEDRSAQSNQNEHEKIQDKQGIRNHSTQFRTYFSNRRHAIALFAVSFAWFLNNISTYGISLNQPTILALIGYANGATKFDTLWKTGVGSIIIQAAGNVPGDIISIWLPDLIGRRNMQFFFGIATAVVMAAWAGVGKTASAGGQITLLTLSQLFVQTGVSGAIFLLPVELFPTRVRATAYGIAAGSGQAGGLLTAFSFGNFVAAAGIPGVVGFLASLYAIVGCVVWLVPETKGSTLEDIENDVLFRKGRPADLEHLTAPSSQDDEEGVTKATVTSNKA